MQKYAAPKNKIVIYYPLDMFSIVLSHTTSVVNLLQYLQTVDAIAQGIHLKFHWRNGTLLAINNNINN